jgi:hypothetical protein
VDSFRPFHHLAYAITGCLAFVLIACLLIRLQKVRQPPICLLSRTVSNSEHGPYENSFVDSSVLESFAGRTVMVDCSLNECVVTKFVFHQVV